jgi:hypothetical protein
LLLGLGRGVEIGTVAQHGHAEQLQKGLVLDDLIAIFERFSCLDKASVVPLRVNG